MLAIVNGTAESFTRLEDFRPFLDDAFGLDMYDALEDVIDEERYIFSNDCMEKAEEYEERVSDHYMNILRDLLQEAEALQEMTTAKRMNRKKIQDAAQLIIRMIGNEL